MCVCAWACLSLTSLSVHWPYSTPLFKGTLPPPPPSRAVAARSHPSSCVGLNTRSSSTPVRALTRYTPPTPSSTGATTSKRVPLLVPLLLPGGGEGGEEGGRQAVVVVVVCWRLVAGTRLEGAKPWG
jgi:uncharacterized membrane protein